MTSAVDLKVRNPYFVALEFVSVEMINNFLKTKRSDIHNVIVFFFLMLV